MSPRSVSALGFSRRAFTLVEVALAIGVVSFALLSLLGLFPIGLISFRESMTQTACSHMMQKVAGDLALMPRDEVAAYIARPQYFNYDGNRVEPGADGQAVFVVKFAPQSPRYPGSARLADLGDYLTSIAITISRTGGNEGTTSNLNTLVFRTSVSLANSKR